MKRLSLIILILFASHNSFAGLIEVGISTSYRNSEIDTDNFTESLSVTGSISYYFWEMSALEFSYTKGEAKQSLKGASDTETTVATSEFELYGLDFVLSFAGKEDAFQPFIKVGAAQVNKKYKLKPPGQPEMSTGTQKGLTPSAGIGAKIRLSKSFAFKFGVDAWTSPIDDDEDNPETVDYAARVGLSWYF